MVKSPHNPMVPQCVEEVNCTVAFLTADEMKQREAPYSLAYSRRLDDPTTVASYSFFIEKGKRRYLVYMNPYAGKYPVYDVLQLYPKRGPKIIGRELPWDEAHAVVDKDQA